LTRVYKILTRRAWAEAETSGAYIGSPLDLKDGFIHLSTAAQAGETAKLHFRGQSDLIIVGFDAETFGDVLKWEPSRGGRMFPHLFEPLPVNAMVSIDALPLDDAQVPIVPTLVP